MKPIYDIRDQIPRFAANFFTPPDPDQIYPRVMVNPETGKPYVDRSKKEIVFHNEEEEKAFLATRKGSVPVVEAPKAVEIPLAAIAPQRPQFEAITSAEAEKAEPKRRGRPPLPKNLTA